MECVIIETLRKLEKATTSCRDWGAGYTMSLWALTSDS